MRACLFPVPLFLQVQHFPTKEEGLLRPPNLEELGLYILSSIPMRWHKVLLHPSAASSIIGKCSQWNKEQMPQMLGSSFQISAFSLMLARDFHCVICSTVFKSTFSDIRSNMSSCPQREGWSQLLSSPLLEAEICMCYSQHKFNNNSFFRHQEIRASNMLPLAA